MTTYVFWAVCAIAVMLLVGRIPGLQFALSPVLWAVGETGKGVFAFVGYWLLFAFKGILRAHRELIVHLMSDESEYDIQIAMRKRERE